MHTFRLMLLLCLLVLIRLQHARDMVRESQRALWEATIAQAQTAFPHADHWGEPDLRTGARSILDASGKRLGFALQTAPQANDIIGFSGPSNLLLLFDTEEVLRSAEILSSRDTRDHVQQIVDSPGFLPKLKGLTWTELAAAPPIDAVSGATLTSMAMYQGIVQRLGGDRPNRLFPDDPPVEWVQEVFPEGRSLTVEPGSSSLYAVRDEMGHELGQVLRTTPAADQVIGYQGPTETLVCLKPTDPTDPNSMRVCRIVIGRSYDNAEYVAYLREDWSFPELFNDRSLEELGHLNLEAEGIQGVSGATMSSMAVARGIVAAALELSKPKQPVDSNPTPRTLKFTWRDAGTCGVALAAIGLIWAPLRRRRWVRLVFQCIVIGYLGLLNGDLLSQAMFVGWAQSGVPWMTALGLVVLTVVSFSIPTITRQNVYCSHLCPHGAVQQLMAQRIRNRWTLGLRGHTWLSRLPAALLIWCVLVAMTHWSFSLVDIEPFDAWVFRIAGWPTLLVAIAGLLAAIRIPMAYCRYGCPTGMLLQYVRRHARSDQLQRADFMAILAVALAVSIYWFDLCH